MLTSTLPWVILGTWMAVVLPVLLSATTTDGRSPIDFLSYRWAADRIAQGNTPYATVEQARATWLTFHQMEADLLAASERGTGAQTLQAQAAQPQRPGPYLYPPTLASSIAAWHISERAFLLVLGLAILGFSWLWLRSADASSWWLLLVIGSWDVLASWSGGNVEHLMLVATLVGARLLWTGRGWLAAAPIALVVVVKPFYVLFFIVFGMLQIRGAAASGRGGVLRSLAGGAAGTSILVGLEVARWGPELRAETVQYLRTSLESLWLVLPVDQQTPMSAWNRTPLQVLVQWGLPAAAVQVAALAVWGLLVAFTVWRVDPARLGWAHTCALAFVLLYLGRPVGWGLIYLELLVLTVVWREMRRWPRTALLLGAGALMSSHWWALVLATQGQGLPLLTLQSAQWPWETLLVLPLAWWLLVRPRWSSVTSGTSLP